MKTILLSLLALASFVGAFGRSTHLVLRSQGDGAFYKTADGKVEPLARASFLPADVRLTVRPRSGVETLRAGYHFRFGSDTSFTLGDDSLFLHEGSIMMLSRKIGESVVLSSPETQVKLSGIGTCMTEVEPNGGLKLLCVLGRILIFSNAGKFEILPGELIFAKPGELGMGDKINVNLGTVVKSSYLLSGFPNSSSFQNSLSSVVEAQKNSIGKTYRAEVGHAKGANTFEVLPIPDAMPEDAFPTVPPIADKPSYEVSSSDPLTELLGRAPKRLAGQDKVETKDSLKHRPFPSKLLRSN
jgi:hypothetical protein